MFTRAAVLHSPRKLEIETFELERSGIDDGILRVEATGVCGTDIASYNGTFNEYEVPRVLGHEVIGTVEELGKEAAARWGVDVGDRIAVEEYLPCGTCPACLDGAYTTCGSAKYGSRGVASIPSVWGSFSDFMYLSPRSIIHCVPDGVSPVLGQLYIPIANGLHWIQNVARFRAGGTAVVLGPGAHGLACVVAAKETGAENVVLVGLRKDRHRLEVGRRLGATHLVIVDDGTDAAAQIGEITGGRMADAVINLAPAADALALAISVARERATVVHAAIGGTSMNTSIPADRILRKTLTVTGVRGRPAPASSAALNLISSKRYPLDLVTTHAFTLDDTDRALNASAADHSVVRAVVACDDAASEFNRARRHQGESNGTLDDLAQATTATK